MCDCSNKLNFFENMFRIKTKIYVFMRLKIEKKYEKDVVCELRPRGHYSSHRLDIGQGRLFIYTARSLRIIIEKFNKHNFFENILLNRCFKKQ